MYKTIKNVNLQSEQIMIEYRGDIKSPLFMMINTNKIKQLIEEKLTDKDCFLVDLSVSDSNQINVEIDSVNGISINDCVDFSRQIEHNLDRDNEDFSLNVSSPGLSNPFKVFLQYKKNINKDVEVLKTNGEKIRGKMIEVDEHKIKITYNVKEKVEGKKKKQIIEKQEIIPFTEIKETKIVIKFN